MRPNSQNKFRKSFSKLPQFERRSDKHGYTNPTQIINQARKSLTSFYPNNQKSTQQKQKRPLSRGSTQKIKTEIQIQQQKKSQKKSTILSLSQIPIDLNSNKILELYPYKKLEPLSHKPKIIQQKELKFLDQQNKPIILQSIFCYNTLGQPEVKNIISNEVLNDPQKQIKDTNWILDNINSEDKNVAPLLCDQILNTPQTPQEIQENKEINQQFQKDIKSQLNSKNKISLICLALKKSYKRNNINIKFRKKSSAQTQISMNHLVNGFLSQLTKVTQNLQEEDRYKLKDIDKSNKNYLDFIKWYKKKVKHNMGIDEENIIIHQVNCYHAQIKWSTPQAQKVYKYIPKSNGRVKIHPIFENLFLSQDDFDYRGNFKFGDTKSNIQKRGYWPYFQPVLCQRIGLNVKERYDNGDDKWLGMDNQKYQWAVAFHGTNINHVYSILKQDRSGPTLRPGYRNLYKNKKALNRDQQVGIGVYCTPHIQTALQFSDGVTIQGKVYFIVFQCRINPNEVLICDNNIYWVIRQSKNIRPYGIVLIQEEKKKMMPSSKQQFGQEFIYQKYKQQIKKSFF